MIYTDGKATGEGNLSIAKDVKLSNTADFVVGKGLKGAVDFLPKPFEDKDLLFAIEQAIHKSRQKLKQEKEISHIKSLLSAISPREYEVMRWVIAGLLNKQIAQKMGITEKTVKVHRGRVMKKMQVDSVVELFGLLEKVGISPPES